VGETSVARIAVEASSTITTVARSLAVSRGMTGRAKPTISPARPSSRRVTARVRAAATQG
jgi:hypothetical protein